MNLHGPGGRASLRADAADNDVLAYDDPLRMLVGLKNLLKQQHVAGHGQGVAQAHVRAQRLLASAELGRAILEREITSIRSHHDPHPGRVAPVRFLVGDITGWLAENQYSGRDDTEDARQLRKAHAELEQLIADAENAHPSRRNQFDDALHAPVRFAERTAEGVKEVGAMAVDSVALGVDAIGEATGIGTFDYHPISKYGRSIEATGAGTTTALVTMVNGFADEWTDAVERAKHGDYRGVTDVSIDTLLLIDGTRTGGVIALDKAEAVVAKLGNVANSARAVAQSAHASAGAVSAEVCNIAAAMADGADAFVAKLRAGGMQMATSGGSGGSGPNFGGLSAETLAEAAQAAKEAFDGRRAGQEAATQGDPRPTREGAISSAESDVGRDPMAAHEERHMPLERKPFRTRDGVMVEAVEQGRAVVPTGKVEVYPRGKVKPFTKEMAQELKSLKNDRQTARKEFDKDPNKAARLEELERFNYNQQRSREMTRSLERAGLPDTPTVNDEIIRHLLEVGQRIDASNRVCYPSEVSGSAGAVKLLSTWLILPDGRALLSSLNVIPL